MQYGFATSKKLGCSERHRSIQYVHLNCASGTFLITQSDLPHYTYFHWASLLVVKVFRMLTTFSKAATSFSMEETTLASSSPSFL